MNSKLFYAAVIYIIALCVFLVCGNIYYSPKEIVNLVTLQKIISERLQAYVNEEMGKISHLRRYLNNLKEQHSKATADTQVYIGNPLNRFLLVKRLTRDLIFVKALTDLKPDYKPIDILPYPTNEDMTTAASSVARLQETYLLDVQQLAAGKLKGYNSTPMSTRDCYELGRVLYENYNYETSRDWLLQAYQMLDPAEKEQNPTFVAKIVEALCFNYICLNDEENIKKWVKNLKNLKIGDEFTSTVQNYLKKWKERKKLKKKDEDFKIELHKNITRESGKLCRGEMQVAPEIQRRLKCRYLMNKPFLKLAPLKMEQLYINPDIYMFYDVISDTEIKKIKSSGYPKLVRAQVNRNMTAEITNDRISFITWLSGAAEPAIRKVYRRIEDMTGLSTASAESLQLALYPPGGLYKSHLDAATNASVHKGYRIATVMFYLSDVTEGGATVFIYSGVSVFPVKGAALFWHNTHNSGVSNRNTLHSACPVLLGYKWAANVWLHSYGQEFLHPCQIGGDKINETRIPPVWKLAGNNSNV